MFALDRTTGKELWAKPVDIRKHAIQLNQPTRSPLLVFAGRTTDNSGMRMNVKCLDKRTGRVVYDEVLNSRAQNQDLDRCDIVVQPLNKEVVLEAHPNRVVLTLTDEPIQQKSVVSKFLQSMLPKSNNTQPKKAPPIDDGLSVAPPPLFVG